MPTNDVKMNVKILIHILLSLQGILIVFCIIELSSLFILWIYEFTYGFSIGKPIIILIIYDKDQNFKVSKVLMDMVCLFKIEGNGMTNWWIFKLRKLIFHNLCQL